MSASGTSTTRGYAWTPSAAQIESSRLRSFLAKLSVDDVAALNELARRDPERFWSATVDDIGIGWVQRPTRMRDTGEGLPFTRWWRGGRLNLAGNAAGRWARTQPDHDAVVWEGDDGSERVWSYGELAAQTARCANGLRELGVEPGDAVGLCLPMIPETVAVFLACSQVGAMVIPLFSGYGAGAIVARLQDCEAKVLVIADGFLRRGAAVSMKPVADLVAEQTPSLRHVIVVRRLGTVEVRMEAPRDVRYEELTARQPAVAETADSSADDPFMLIYTSGTTGRPKGTVHVQGGFPIKATQDMAHCFDVGPADRLLWFTDIGWMMGPWAICGTLTIGATLVLFEGVPDHPGPDRLWSVVSKHRVTVLGVAPTVVRALMRHGGEPVHAHDLSSLRVLGSSGEPWNAGPWQWFLDQVGGGRCPIINYSGGTEVSGGIVAGNMLTPLNPCAFAGPCPGMDADVLDENGNSVRNQMGELVVRSPWPGMTSGFWHDRARYLETYWSRWPDIWRHGDWAEIAEDGLWYIRGRSDDTIKLAGKRLGPAEVESALVADPGVAEAAAVGVPDALKGEALVCFVVLKPGVADSDELRASLSERVSVEMGKALRPKAVLVIAELPKTRNAKVLRRIVRAVYLGDDPGDLSSLENPSAIDALEAVRATR
ncbi:MAG TPA: AMP-binding protein [Candidatus Dormibacteraeota bacterium]|nr:AMP-binding protein [Candidatus Dormibacteraeota bacterium]